MPGRGVGCGFRAIRWPSPTVSQKTRNNRGCTCVMNCTPTCSVPTWKPFSNKGRRWSSSFNATPKCSFFPAAKCLTFTPAKATPKGAVRCVRNPSTVVASAPGSTNCGARSTSSARPEWASPAVPISITFSMRASHRRHCSTPASACCAMPATCCVMAVACTW